MHDSPHILFTPPDSFKHHQHNHRPISYRADILCSADSLAPSYPASRTGGTSITFAPTSSYQYKETLHVTNSRLNSFKLAAIKLTTPTQDHLEKHYADLSDKPFFKGLITYMGSGPVCAMVWEGRDAVKTGRSILGATNPLASAPGTIRGDYALVSFPSCFLGLLWERWGFEHRG